jgi:hypothetical protein
MRVVLCFAAALGAASAHAQVYKCVDSAGKAVYSQTPCPVGTQSSTIGNRVPAAPMASPSKSAAEQEMGFRKRQKEQEESQKKTAHSEEQAKLKEENCRRAREQSAQFDAGSRIARVNEKGERYFLDDDQIAQEKARAQSLVDQWCK